MRTFIALTLCAAFLAPAQDLPTIKVDVDIVNVLTSVRDKRGALVPNLQKSDFTVFEDGKQQEIKYFARETDVPLTIGLLVDVSGSQRNVLEVERRAAAEFFAKVLRKKDMAFLISFGTETELMQDYTNSTRLLQEGLNKLQIQSGVGGLHPGPVPQSGSPRGTLYYDAVYLASEEKLKSEVGRKVIVAITDGVDMGSRVTINKAVEAAQKSDAVVYNIEYYDAMGYGGGGFGNISLGGGGGGSAMRKLSDETGGRVYKVDRGHPLERVFQELQDEMRSQYSIGYTPLNDRKDGTFRKLEVRLGNKDLKAQARKGYFADKK